MHMRSLYRACLHLCVYIFITLYEDVLLFLDGQS